MHYSKKKQLKLKQSSSSRMRITVNCEKAAKHASVFATTTIDEISIKKYQDLCDHANLSFAHLQTLTTELELIHRENAVLKVANSELVKLVSLAFQASVMQHQHRTLGNNRDVAFERRYNANNVGIERVT
ncbi:hypothetical protein SADUNF_Sadunf12G0021900 [Salix dunnii]|uniref:Uncharacterized protein n=1 Tax=Salix dunnii TaxID=1413687 RepID=A0A835JH89_9ROSI|nr:hypothetical protein SADUNF_Sadunf12G0021900 [Salix dunnii]